MLLQPRPVPMILKDDSPMQDQSHYYWEVKLSHVKYRYSSDGWFGIGTASVTQREATNLIQNNVCPENFWGYGNNGTVAHDDEIKSYGPHFHEGDLLGAHLDLFHGTLEFHLNRKPLGIAYTGLPGNIPLYPVLIGATAIPTPNKIDGPHQFMSSLQLMCYRQITKLMPKDEVLKAVPPGLVPLVKTFEFLHFFTGELAKPELYSRSFEMVIVSEEEEEENFMATRQRRRRRLRPRPPVVAPSSPETSPSQASCSTTRKRRGRPPRQPLYDDNDAIFAPIIERRKSSRNHKKLNQKCGCCGS